MDSLDDSMVFTVFLLRFVAVFALFCAALPGPAAAQDLAGRAQALQADQLIVNGARISLFGIDAPDPDQDRQCTLGTQNFGCYSNARRQLQILLDEGPVACIDSGKRNYVNFPYMTCTIAGKDIGEAMVRTGNALAFLPQSNKYADAEKAAKADKVGIWQTGIRFKIPWEWRNENDRPIFGP